MMPPRQPLNVKKLSDHGGQYIIALRCDKCRHTRDARPETFARLTGWETPLATILTRLRCSKCGARGATATMRRETRREGWELKSPAYLFDWLTLLCKFTRDSKVKHRPYRENFVNRPTLQAAVFCPYHLSEHEWRFTELFD